jgi:hypothetical protein
LLLALLHVPFRDGGSGVGECVEVEEDLVSGLAFVDVVDWEVEVVGCDGALGTLVHNKLMGWSE